jgi:UPF0271 protein
MTALLSVVTPGLLVTVQDRGRHGYQELGVPVAGALDPIGLCLANALVGNAPGVGCLEICYLGPTLKVEASSVRLAIVGDVEIVLKGDRTRGLRLAANRTHCLQRGDIIAVGSFDAGAVAYLAVAGGFDLAPVLGSLATYVRGRLGPLDGLPLRAGTMLPLALDEAPVQPERALPRIPDYGHGPIRVVLGPQDDHFTEDSIATFLSSHYRVTKEADRMGMRLDGPALKHKDRADITSDAAVSGCIQVPGNGQPIILLVDHQTTGGYAKIATIISADLPRVGRMLPDDTLSFRAVTVAEAEAARRDLDARVEAGIRAIDSIAAAELTRLTDRLWSTNLVSGAVDAFNADTNLA